ncbi:MAG: 50S ribosomal protein L1 [Rickettsiales bacterium]|jgi:large subunit ribosomal protein L1|nr:50S ribosomal protein L1 [Rickettsiales bacterium]
MFVSKRIKKMNDGLDKAKIYSVREALETLKARASAKFDETVDVAISLGVDVKQSDQNVRGMVTLPNGTGKKVRVAVFAKGAKADEAKAAGADLYGDDELIAAVLKGEINFDRVIATPDMMAALGKVAKILGPKGLMPNPKLGTVTMDVKGAVERAKIGEVEFRAEKAGIVHAGIGKLSFGVDKLLENFKALASAVAKAKPAAAKGVYIKRASISTTQGVGLKLDVSEVK